MKYLSILIFVLFMAGCHKDSPTSTEQMNPKLGDSINVKIGASVFIQNEQLSFQFINVPEDSRCPLGAMCVWAGNATVVIKIYNILDTMNTTLNPKEVTYGTYRIALLKLSPYPQIGVPRDTMQYVAQFVVTKK